jgi:hypothetical protein
MARLLREGPSIYQRCVIASIISNRVIRKRLYFSAAKACLAAFSIREATACGCDTYKEWLPLRSTTLEPARCDIAHWASGGIILSSAETTPRT